MISVTRTRWSSVSFNFRSASRLRYLYLIIPAASSIRPRRSSGFKERISSTLPWLMMESPSRPRPVSIKSSCTSLSRLGVLLIRYSLSPERYSRRDTVTSSKSKSKIWALLSNVNDTCAIPSGLRSALPAKMTSSILLPRRFFTLCSPNTQRMLSTTLDFPLPLGPTIAVIPLGNSNSTLSAKDLNP